MRLTIKDAYELIRAVKHDISDEYRAFEDDDVPGIQLTIGTNSDLSDWSFQTGDNSYIGGAYHYPYWGVIGVYRNSNCRDLAREIIDQIRDQIE